MYSENCFSHLDTNGKPLAPLASLEEPHVQKANSLVFSPNKFSPEAKVDDGMCFEERVLYRLLSGMHSMTSISVYWKYYPAGTGPKPNSEGGWSPNPMKFMQNFGRHPDRIKNLYFAFVVLLRAVKKGRDFFLGYRYTTGNGEEDERVSQLIKLLLDTENLKFCGAVFEAFDEKSMFLSPAVSRKEFKRGFFHLSSLMNCVKCSRCR